MAAANHPISLDKGASAVHKTTSFSKFSFKYPLGSLRPGGAKKHNGIAVDDAVVVEENGERSQESEANVSNSGSEDGNGNWVLKILHVRSMCTEQGKSGAVKSGEEEKESNETGYASCDGDENAAAAAAANVDDGDPEESDVCRVDDGDDEIEFDRNSFSRMLRRVSLAEAKLYAQMSYLGNLAYSIPNIKPGNLLKYHGLKFVTSSLEKKQQLMKTENEQTPTETSTEVKESDKNSKESEEDNEQGKKIGNRISAVAAYQIAASAASYLYCQTKNILPFKSSETVDNSSEAGIERIHNGDMLNSEVASFMATTDSVTAVVAAKEEVKQAVADDLNSTHSSPCEWFICDDDLSGTRLFVIQGSESLASWKANLLFEPVKFEGLDVLVHRGIYEAAKGIYEQMLPEVRAHLKARGEQATFRFTGHSLGGSLSLLVNLMLLIRHEVPSSSLLPVITFGAPAIMCGGDHLLHDLGLPRSHLQAITMHRDIVPRAFSCNYPNHVAEILKALNGNFRNHPCLSNQKLLYAPMGELLILQPDEKFSPQHHLLPSGSGLYLLACPLSESIDPEKHLRAAQKFFLNSPHPLEILRDKSSYGSFTYGSIQRDHDMGSYVKAIREVIRKELKIIRKAKRDHRRRISWPLVAPGAAHSGITVGRDVGPRHHHNLFGLVKTGRDSFGRFGRLVASQHMHLLVVLLFPVRLLLLGTYSVIGFR